MTKGTVVIPNVDFSLLDTQRQDLLNLTLNADAVGHMEDSQRDAIEGLLHMLDEWSDNRHRENES